MAGKVASGKLEDDQPLIYGRAWRFLNDDTHRPGHTYKAGRGRLPLEVPEEPLVPMFRKRKTSDAFDSKIIHSNVSIFGTVAALNMILAAVPLVGAIMNSYLVRKPKAKLRLGEICTVLFASSVALCTSARRAELFASAATHAAVLVVVISGDLGGSTSGLCLIQLVGTIWKSVKCPG